MNYGKDMNDEYYQRRIEKLEVLVRSLHERVNLLEYEKNSVAEEMPGVDMSVAHEPEMQSETEERHLPPPLPQVNELAVAIAAPEQIESAVEETFTEQQQETTERSPLAVPQQHQATLRVSRDAELRLGQTWAVRIGVLLLFTGFVFLANYAWEHYIRNLGEAARLTILTVSSLGGVCLGEYFRKKNRLAIFGQVIAAGGLAALYYCTYAAHHIERLRVVDSPSMGAILLTITGLVILGYSAWRKASVMCSIALLLSFYGTMIQPITGAALISGLIVAAAGSVLCLRYGWKSVGVVGVIGAYVCYMIWQGVTYEAAAFSIAGWFLCVYWLLFTLTTLHPKSPWKEWEAIAITGFNHAMLGVLLPFDWHALHWDSRCWMVYLGLSGATLIISFLLEKRQGRGILSDSHLIQAIAFLTLAILTKFSGHELFIILGIKGFVLLMLDRKYPRSLIEWSGWAIILLACLVAFTQLGRPTPLVWAVFSAILFACLCAGRAANGLTTDTPQSLRFCVRWVVALISLVVLSFGVLLDLPQAQGALWLLGIAWMLSLATRLIGEKFPAPESVTLFVYSSCLAGFGLCWNQCDVLPWTRPVALALAFAHAITYPQKLTAMKIEHPHEARGALLSILTWSLAVAYALTDRPFVPYTPLLFFTALVAMYVISCKLQWQIFQWITPLFACALWFMLWPLHSQPQWMVYLLATGLLGSAAWLTIKAEQARYTHIFPLFTGALILILQMQQHFAYASIGWVLLTCLILLTPLKRDHAWALLTITCAVLSFAKFSLEDPSRELIFYAVPVIFYAGIGYHHRILQRPSTLLTKIICILMSIVVSIKVSIWVSVDGSGPALTITWAVLAACFFWLGFLLKEPVMRAMMLVLLLCCLGRILVSVWQLGTLMRIVSFMSTGCIFLLLGYVYNKHPEWFGKGDTKIDEPP